MKRRLLVAAAIGGVALAPGCGNSGRAGSGAGPAPSPPQNRFVDRTEASGLGAFQRVDGGSGRKFFPEQMGSGVALLDYDGDGWLDVYFCSGAALLGYKGPAGSNRLFRNRGNGTFEDVTTRAGVASGRYCTGVATGDFDNDGDVDLYLCVFGPNQLYRNNGDGTFTDITPTAGVGDPRLSASAAWGDYDSDGKLDLYVANYVKYDIRRDRWCSKFPGQKSFCGPNLYDAEEDTLYHNNGDGTFTDVSVKAGVRSRRANGLGVIWLDYDADGRQDLFVANDQTPNLLWRNNGDGTFRDIALDAGVAFGEEGNARAGMGVDAGDYNNDGREDLVVTNFSEESNALYQNEGGTFRDVAMATGMGPGTLMFLGFGTGFLDYDRDGWLDLFFANGHVLDDIETYSDSVTWAQPSQLFRNRGDGALEDVSASTAVAEGRRVARGAAFGDVDNDGRTDVVVSTMRGAPWYLHNECAPSAHWLGLDLRPAAGSNVQAIGATVRLSAGGLRQRRDVRANASYGSSNDTRPLFGLGTARRVDEVEIRWPGGKVTKIKEPLLDRYLRVEE